MSNTPTSLCASCRYVAGLLPLVSKARQERSGSPGQDIHPHENFKEYEQQGAHNSSKLMLQVSEDHCWINYNADGDREGSVEVTTDSAATRGRVVAGSAWQGWLYTGGHAVLCSPKARRFTISVLHTGTATPCFPCSDVSNLPCHQLRAGKMHVCFRRMLPLIAHQMSRERRQKSNTANLIRLQGCHRIAAAIAIAIRS